LIWKGYAAVDQWDLHSELWLAGVLEITEALEHALVGKRLRGQVWMLHRQIGREKGPVVGTYSETLPDAQVRKAFSIVPVLERVYHCTTLALGVPNPIPAQVNLSAHEAPAPQLAGDLVGQAQEAKPIDPETMARFRQQMRGMGGNGKGGGK